jgi:predicted RNase H-like HicB family nuclease
MDHYVALIHKDPRSDFGVSFPDFPGCISAGSTYEEAIAMGTEALTAHIALMRESGEKIPAPRSVERIRKDARTRAADDWIDFSGAMITLLPALPLEGQSKAYNVSLPAPLMAALDAYADRKGTTRSGALATAARLLLANDPQSSHRRKAGR